MLKRLFSFVALQLVRAKRFFEVTERHDQGTEAMVAEHSFLDRSRCAIEVVLKANSMPPLIDR
jgi:hypothetical protein